MSEIKSVLFGMKGLSLSKEEADFFHTANPLGFIIFDRNVKNPEQVRALVKELKACVGRDDAPILVDQEGGRVQRLWPPYWEGLPFARTYGDWYVDEAPEKGLSGVQMHAEKLAKMLLDLGINVDCWPSLDVACGEIHDVLGKRLFSTDKEVVMTLGKKAVESMLQNGLMPVIKHLPGYGRATVDPHLELPMVKASLEELEQDFYPFRHVNLPVWGMTAHVLYQALDEKNPATLSTKVLNFVRHKIGFHGFLVSDDISMGALRGDVAENAEACVEAGCDAVLHCKPDLAEMKRVAEKVPVLSEDALLHLQKAKELLK